MYIESAKKHRQMRVINATEGGAYIENTELMTLAQAIEECCNREVNFKEAIENMQPEFSQDEYKKIVEYVHKLPQEFR